MFVSKSLIPNQLDWTPQTPWSIFVPFKTAWATHTSSADTPTQLLPFFFPPDHSSDYKWSRETEQPLLSQLKVPCQASNSRSCSLILIQGSQQQSFAREHPLEIIIGDITVRTQQMCWLFCKGSHVLGVPIINCSEDQSHKKSNLVECSRPGHVTIFRI